MFIFHGIKEQGLNEIYSWKWSGLKLMCQEYKSMGVYTLLLTSLPLDPLASLASV